MTRPRTQIGKCVVPNCAMSQYSRGLCQRHYNRVWRRGHPLAGERAYEFELRFQKGNGCWNWIGALSDRGYGKFSLGKRKVRAHRFAYELYVAKIPQGMQVLHSCDNPKCVNPKHLWLGTHLDNMRDMEAKGRARWIQDNLRGKHE